MCKNNVWKESLKEVKIMENKNFFIVLFSSVLAVFAGAFFAFFAVFGNIHKNYQTSFFSDRFIPITIANRNDSLPQFDKIFEKQQKLVDEINKDFDNLMNQNLVPAGFMFLGHNNTGYGDSTGIKTEEMKDCYKITVDLKPFNKDEKNVDVKVKDSTISISAKYQQKDKSKFSSSQFYQALTLPGKLSSKDIKQQKHGDSLVITISKKDSKG